MLKTMKSPRLNEVKLRWEDDMTGLGFEILCQAKILGLEQGKLFWFGTGLSWWRRLKGTDRLGHSCEAEGGRGVREDVAVKEEEELRKIPGFQLEQSDGWYS